MGRLPSDGWNGQDLRTSRRVSRLYSGVAKEFAALEQVMVPETALESAVEKYSMRHAPQSAFWLRDEDGIVDNESQTELAQRCMVPNLAARHRPLRVRALDAQYRHSSRA
jgi:hypothetical protein